MVTTQVLFGEVLNTFHGQPFFFLPVSGLALIIRANDLAQ